MPNRTRRAPSATHGCTTPVPFAASAMVRTPFVGPAAWRTDEQTNVVPQGKLADGDAANPWRALPAVAPSTPLALAGCQIRADGCTGHNGVPRRSARGR